MAAREDHVMCEEKSRLAREFSIAADRYSAAVTQLHARLPVSPKNEYDRLKFVAEAARLASEAARMSLEEHAAAHGC